MYRTTYITRYTRAVLDMVCRSRGVTRDELRLGALKGAAVDLANFLENPLEPLHPDDRAALQDLRDRVRLALGDE